MRRSKSKANNSNIDLIRAFIQVDGGFRLTDTCYNKDGSVKCYTDRKDKLSIIIDAENVKEISSLTSIDELHDYYKEMKYFPERR